VQLHTRKAVRKHCRKLLRLLSQPEPDQAAAHLQHLQASFGPSTVHIQQCADHLVLHLWCSIVQQDLAPAHTHQQQHQAGRRTAAAAARTSIPVRHCWHCCSCNCNELRYLDDLKSAGARAVCHAAHSSTKVTVWI
jgi:hypothetical protein